MNRSKLTACLLAVIFCFGILTSAVWADEPETDLGAVMPENDTFDFVEGDALDELQEAAALFPSAYDLRHVPTEDGGEVSYVTPVRLQNPYGTCWGFAAIAAAESSLLSSGLAAESGYDENTLDLSEKHVSFFATSFIEDPDDPQYGEGVHFRDITDNEAASYSYRYNTGGFAYLATCLFASGIGPVYEKVIDPETNEEVYFDMFAYRGENSEVAYWESAMEYDDAGQPVEGSYRLAPVWYSDEDNWYIPEEYRYYQSYRIKDFLVLPNPAGINEDGEYEFHPEAVDAIKQQISQYHRAVSINFTAETYLPGQDTGGKEYMSENWAHFTNIPQYSNHSVTIVGYDDAYPKENFNSSTENGGPAQPEGDGAFLVKNSWGSELNDFPNNGHRHWGLLDGLDVVPYDPNAKAKEGNKASGYFWISYYDRSLEEPEAFVFDKVTGENGFYVEQMDCMNAAQIGEKWSEESIMMANVFAAKATSRLSEISVVTTIPGTEVSYSVYLLGEGYADPTDGILIEQGVRSFEYGGYHRIDLDSPQVLTKGQRYSVLIEESAEGIYSVCFPVEFNFDDYYIYSVGVINPGESFYYREGKWGDLADSELQLEIISDFGDLSEYDLEVVLDNFPIKSYLEPITYPNGETEPVFEGYLTVNNWLEGNTGIFGLAVGESKALTAEFRGLGFDMPGSWDPSFEWVSADEGMLSVSTSTPKKGRAVITGLEPGATQLIVYAGDGDSDPDHSYPDNYGVKVLTIIVYPEYEDFGAYGYASAAQFDDVSETYWGREAIGFVTELGLMRGVSETAFAPEESMSRAMAATVLYRMMQEPEVSAAADYDDVAEGSWYSDAIAWASADGIVEGYGRTFGTDDPVTREQMVVMLWRLSGEPDAASVETGASAWAADAMSWAVEVGLIEGDAEGYRAGSTASRAEAATLFMRFIVL